MDVKVIEEPKIYLMGSMGVPMDSPQGPYLFHEDETNGFGSRPEEETGKTWGEDLVEHAGRLCYMSFDKRRPGGNKAYINHILDQGHGSCLEHATYSFIFTGVSRSLTHQLIRHRAGWSYSELSQRFVDLSDVAFVIPPAYIGNATLTEEWKDGCLASLKKYDRLVALTEQEFPKMPRKEVREAARSALPESVETKIACTANARALRHFFELRGSLHADAEIARLAVRLCKMMREYAPNLFGDYDVMCEADGREWIETKYKKV